ncbi:zinc finger MYM-type protein 3-like isoform X2 [Lineus longissimus]|uniref:zinc finger MYM-type protein 3-like isoform X2 n=1 Tax=Lineus longissimus TaxID=88925 RepID=UPI00315DF825
MADDVTDSDISIAPLKSDETGDGTVECDSLKNQEETISTNQDEETGDVGSSGVHAYVESSDVQDENAPSSSNALDTGAENRENQDLMPDSSVEAPGDNGMKEADSGAVDSSDNLADNTNVESSTSPLEEDGGVVDSSGNVDLVASPENDDIVETVTDGDIGLTENDAEEADRLLGTPVQDEIEDGGVSSTVQEESAEQDQSVPESSGGIADEAMDTGEVDDPDEVGSEAPDAIVVECATDVARDGDSVVPVGDDEPCPSGTAEKDNLVKDDTESAEVSEASVAMEVDEVKDSDASEVAVVPIENETRSTIETTDVAMEEDMTNEADHQTEKEQSEKDVGVPLDDEKVKSEDVDAEEKTEANADAVIKVATEEVEADEKVEEREEKKEDVGVIETKNTDDREAGDVDIKETQMKEEAETKDTDTKDESDVESKESKKSPGDTDAEPKKGAGEAMETEEAGSAAEGESKSPKEVEEKKEEEQNVLKDYAGDVMDDFLGMFGLDKLDEDEKEKLSVSDKFSSEKAAALAKATGSAPSPTSAQPTTTSTATPPPKPTAPAAAAEAVASKSSSPAGGKAQGKPVQKCIVCQKVDKCKYNIVRNGDIKHLCDDNCFKTFRANPATYLKAKEPSLAPAAQAPAVTDSPGPVMTAIEKECVVCNQTSANKAKQFLAWQGMNYCSEICLGKFQAKLSKTCAYCEQDVAEASKAKFCMSLGKEVKHFCQPACLEDFRKRLKLCAFCQTDLSKNSDSFAAPVGKGTGFKDFCSQTCLQKYEDKLFNKDKEDKGEDGKENDGIPGVRPRTRSASGLATCAVCGKMSTIKHEVTFEGKPNKLCSDPCFAAFRYTNKLSMNKCDLCGAHVTEGFHVQYEGHQKKFCSILCVNTFKVAKKKMVACAWCAAKKSNFDMIERVDPNNKFQLFCSLNCLSLYRVNIQATSNQRVSCDQCHKHVPAQYHLTMSDASVRNFCSYTCVVAFQAQFNQNRKPANAPARGKPQMAQQQMATRTIAPTTQQKILAAQKAKTTGSSVPVISNVMSLAPPGQKPGLVNNAPRTNVTNQATGTAGTQTVLQKVMIQPPAPKSVKNKSLLCKPFTQTKATTCRPHTQTKETQTDDGDMQGKPLIIPIPVPIYVPCPAAMYSCPTPVLVPMPVPIPVPVFIPTTKNSSASIFKYMQEIQEKMPSDPFEAELLMMAAAVASGPESDEEDLKKSTYNPPVEVKPIKKPEVKSEKVAPNIQPAPPAQDLMGEDMLQMALRLATEMTEPVDLESSLDSAAAKADSGMPYDQENEPMVQESKRGGKGRKRAAGGRGSRAKNKRQRVDEEPDPPPQVQEAVVQPDANLVLKYTYGVNAWKHWVLQKNTQLEKVSKHNHRIKLFKTDILQCTSDELNYTLCLFVKEVRKPNGEEYAPDSIYYLCLGIQMYLFENSRVDNIFTDIYYEKFTECLNEVSMRYEPRYAPSGHLICRIEEEHLWECKQLGAHSPHVLLNTLIYFNTRDFALKNPQEHLRLSFSHIMKHWKKTGSNSLCPSPVPANIGGTNAANKNAGRTVYLRYYAPAPNAKGNKSKKKEKDDSPVFEQAENTDNPLRCPVKLYEFYLSKCPESIRNRNDVFYLVPERSCVPDSPVWYSAASLGTDSMAKMLNRLRMVKEIQESCHGAFNVGFTP